MVRRLRAAGAGAVLLATSALAASFAAAGDFPYRALQRISVDGTAPVRALAFGPGGKHVYAVSGDELHSYDTASGEPGPIAKLPGFGVGLAATAGDGGVLYIVTRAPARLLILSLRNFRITASAALRSGAPSALLYDGGADALYVESRAAASVVRLDPKSGKRLGVAHLTGRLEQMAINGRGTLYVTDAAGGELQAIETGTMKRLGAIPLPGCSAPTGLAMDAVGRRLFVACGNGEALVVDEEMGFVFQRLPIEKAASLRTVFTFHPLGTRGWKGGAFVAGTGRTLDAIRMKAFIDYVGGGSLALSGRCTALAVSAPAHRLVLAVTPDAAPGAELLMLGDANSRRSP